MSKQSERRRQLRRNREHASMRRMVEIAEQRVLHKAREEGRMYCAYQLPSSSWFDKAGVEHVVQPAVCNGRMKPIKKGGAIVEGVVRCARCGRDAIVVAASVPVIPDPPVPELDLHGIPEDLDASHIVPYQGIDRSNHPTSQDSVGTDPATSVTNVTT